MGQDMSEYEYMRKKVVRYCCVLSQIQGAPYVCYGIIEDGVVIATQVSHPDYPLIEKPALLKFKRAGPMDVQVRTPNPQEFVYSSKGNGEQPRKSTWRRAGKRVEGGT